MTDELQEKIIWQNINSSKEKGKILNGKIIAIEVEKMIASAKENNVFLMEAMWARLVPGTIKLLELIENGLLGEIKGV